MTTNLVEKLPEIPEKRYFTIGEVSELCAVKPHVLRYWEQEFPQLHPVKRYGNRRYYQKDEILLLRQIRDLLYQQGFTISGARQQLRGEVPPAAANDDSNHAAKPRSRQSNTRKRAIRDIRLELEGLLKRWPD
ncbi:MAG: MerR family transcriptional regulator [Nevskiaceae bacterium]|nr:MAG: MerR family transcriptional regulator [Nevskiaceae bacterium]TBR74071.1 MAG: MerR family transcriptional regulator [Nevskiaceae bacterium]